MKARPHEKCRSSRVAITMWKVAFAVAFHAIRVVFAVFRRVGDRRASRLARLLMPLFAVPTQGRRARNLSRYHGPESLHIHRLNAAYLRHLARLGIEFARALRITPEALRRHVALEGEEHLRAALDQKRGVLLLGNHLGLFHYPPLLLGARGYAITAAFTSLRLPMMARYLSGKAARLGLKLAFIHNGADRQASRSLRNNEIFYAAVDDVDEENRTLWSPFGRTTMGFNRSAAALATRYRPVVLRATCCYSESGGAVVRVRPMPSAEASAAANSLETLCKHWIECFRREFDSCPEQWWPWTFTTLGGGPQVSPTPSRLRARPGAEPTPEELAVS